MGAVVTSENKKHFVTLHICLTGEEEEAALDRASYGLQFDYIHRLADVHGAGHAPQGASDVFCHLLNSEHLQQLIEDIRETVQQRSLRTKTKSTEKSFVEYVILTYIKKSQKIMNTLTWENIPELSLSENFLHIQNKI